MFTLPETNVECWDYTFTESSKDVVYVPSYDGKTDKTITVHDHPMWKFIIMNSTADGLMARLHELYPELDDLLQGFIKPEPKELGEVLRNWRLIEWNGRKVCVYGCADYTPETVVAFPGGPIAPVSNGWLYYTVHVEDGELVPVCVELAGVQLPIVTETPSELVEIIAEDETIDVSLLEDKEFRFLAVNPLALAQKHPVVCFRAKPFPLHPILNMNPNHRPDSEELLLTSLSS